METRLTDVMKENNKLISRIHALEANKIFRPNQVQHMEATTSTTTTMTTTTVNSSPVPVQRPTRTHGPPRKPPVLPTARTSSTSTDTREPLRPATEAVQERPHVRLGMNVHPAMRLSYQLPEPIRIQKLPKTLLQLLDFHRTARLHTYDKVDKRAWSASAK